MNFTANLQEWDAHTIRYMKVENDPVWTALARQFEEATLHASNEEQASSGGFCVRIQRTYKKMKNSVQRLVTYFVCEAKDEE
ncbi:hypothetical protein NHQ30_004548 [Ciborinia camelliae]|nr:hypothetical protein NHQ30_004548 [Ciborinia camelliae]